MRNLLLTFGTIVMLLSSCNIIASIIHDDDVVARVGDNKLYISELRQVVPEFASAEDSASFARMYINSWAKEMLYAEQAANNLSKADLDVSHELEEYRRTLLKYRYEQQYMSERLDTLVTEDQIREYYDSHKSTFQLERPVLKLRFADVPKDNKGTAPLMEFMASEEYDPAVADSLASEVAIKYYDKSQVWTDAIVVAKDFSMPYQEMMSYLKKSWIVVEPEGRSDMLVAFVEDVVFSGDAPVEYCADRIREYILSARKHAILNGLEQDLLEDALEHNKFVIYK